MARQPFDVYRLSLEKALKRGGGVRGGLGGWG